MLLYIFVADALRYDYMPDLNVPGSLIKTVAASTNSPTSFATLTSGLHPWEHGLYTFVQQIDEAQTFLSEDGNVVNLGTLFSC